MEETCPYCKSAQIIKRGIHRGKYHTRQRYSCLECKRRFIISDIPRIRATPKLICLAMDCYYKGLSFRDIADQFKQFYDLSVSHVTIRTWVLRFSRLLDERTRGVKPMTWGVWGADETLCLTKRGHGNATESFDYVWNVMDQPSGFLLASVCSGRKRSSKQVKHVMLEAAQQSGKEPYRIITDRYKAYGPGIRKAFKIRENKIMRIRHTSILGRRRVINNNAIENLHGNMKDFYKVRRGVKHLDDYTKGYKVFHNFIRKSAGDHQTPADRCGIGISQTNRWEALLRDTLKHGHNAYKVS